MKLHCNEAPWDESSPPTLSVVMPNYNDSRFIAAALESLLAQTRPADEIIVVDDASTDDSVAIVNRLAMRRPELRLIRHPRNLGAVQASNAGLAAARGDYVFFLAANDISKQRFFERAMALFSLHPQAAVCSGLVELVDEDGRFLDMLPTPRVAETPAYIPPDLARRLLAREGNWIVGGTCIYRTDALRAIGGFDARLLSFCDAFVGPVLAARYGACFVPEALGAWRQHAGGLAAATMQDPQRVLTILDEIRRRGPHVAPELFTPFYVSRLIWRLRFESVSTILRQGRTALPPGFARLVALPDILAGVLGRLAARGGAGRHAAIMALLLWLRPFDVAQVLRRRLSWRQRGGNPGND